MEQEDVLATIPGQDALRVQPKEPKADLSAEKALFDEIEEKAKEDSGAKPKKAEKAPKAEKEKPAAKPTEPPKKAGEVEKLRAKLLLAGAPKSAVETLTDEDVREWWKNQEERESDRQKALDRASAAEKKLEALSQATAKPSEPQRGVPTEAADLGEIAKELADQFGDDESGTLIKALEALTAPLTQKISELETVINAARERGAKDISRSNRERIGEDVSFLADSDEAWESVHALAQKVAQSEPSKFSSAEAYYDYAAKALYGPLFQAAEAAPEEEDEHAEEKARIAASAPTPPAATRRQKKVTPLDAARAAWDVLDKGDSEDVDGARRTYVRLNGSFT